MVIVNKSISFIEVNLSFEGFYINLDTSIDRRNFMENQINRLGLEKIIKRKPASVGDTYYSQILTAGELGCFLSHKSLIKGLGAKVGLILEDDVILPTNFTEAVCKLTDKVKELNWDIIFLGTSFDYTDLYRIRTMLRHIGRIDDLHSPQFEGFDLIPANPWYVFGTFAYLVNPDAAAKIHQILELEMSLGFPKQIDLVYRDSVRTGKISAALVFPFLVGVSDEFTTDISSRPDTKEHRRKLKALNLFVGRHSKNDLLLDSYRNLNFDFDEHAFIVSQIVYEFLLDR